MRAELKYTESGSRFYADKDTQDAYAEEDGSGLPLIRFHSLDQVPGTDAAFTTRYGGVSTGCLAELNLGFDRGDDPENVRTNYRRAVRRLGGEIRDLALTRQVHKTEIVSVVPALTLGEIPERKIKEADGLYTDVPGIILSATFADCVPIFLADRYGRRIAVVHSGWKGTVARIAEKGAAILKAEGTRAEDIIAVIGPCISRAHYEVTEEVVRAFRSVFPERECSDIIKKTDDRHSLIDLPAACWYTLVHAGVRESNIHFSGLCTYENPECLFSHRASGGKRGNMNAIFRIRK